MTVTPTDLRNKARIWHRFADEALSQTNKETYSSAAKAFDDAADRIEKLENDLCAARDGLTDLVARAHGHIRNSQTSIG